MKNIYLINYAVKGIKTIDESVRLSFYKKTISKDYSVRGYNVKGIYGANGTGKSAIISSVRILRNLIINDSYLNNPVVQKQLDEMVNKRLGFMEIEAEYLVFIEGRMRLYRYQVKLGRDETTKFCITGESLAFRSATSHSDVFTQLFCVENGNLSFPSNNDSEIMDYLFDRSKNLLKSASLASLFVSGMLPTVRKQFAKNPFTGNMLLLYLFGRSLYVYLDDWDDHTDYIVASILYGENEDDIAIDVETALAFKYRLRESLPYLLSEQVILVSKNNYTSFEKEVRQLYKFLHIFKSDLQNISIEKKEDADSYRCSLVMNYQSYNVNAEFESTGIRKLIRMFAFLKKAAEGEIVFIDELDSNLHDVYLCALLEYLMDYGEGQLCFTTHNIGPMDVLKRNKKSIDFLSVDHTIYPWKPNGNYSPSRLYRNGMIEGSPFNVDSVDFLSVFHSIEEEGEK